FGDTIPARDGRAAFVAYENFLVISEDSILMFDGAVAMENRLGNSGDTNSLELPFQIADPKHQIGNGDGARIEFEPIKLARRDGMAFHEESVLGFTELFKGGKHF